MYNSYIWQLSLFPLENPLFCPLVLRPTLSPCRQVAAETSQAEDHRHTIGAHHRIGAHGLDGKVDRQWTGSGQGGQVD